MEILSGLLQINYWAVLAATVASFVIGFLRYHPKVFGTMWMKAEGLTPDDAKKGNLGLIMTVSFVLAFIKAALLALLVGGNGIIAGAVLGGVIGIGFVALSTATHFLYTQRSFMHFFMVAGYDIVLFIVMGMIVAAW